MKSILRPTRRAPLLAALGGLWMAAAAGVLPAVTEFRAGAADAASPLHAAGPPLHAAGPPLDAAGSPLHEAGHAAQEPGPQATPDDAPRIVWPDLPGTASVRGLELLAPSPGAVDPWPLERPRDDASWTGAWERFAADLLDEAAARTSGEATNDEDAQRRARLCLASFHQGRDADGWRHFAELGALDPGLASTLLPHLVVGAPLADTTRPPAPDGPSAWDGRLAEGVVLRPVLPPPDPLDPKRRPVREGHDVTGLTIGASRVSMRLHVRGDGVDLRFRLDEGPPVSFAAAIPCPPGVRIAIEYYDWERAESVGEPLPVNLTEPGQWYRLWGRLRLARAAWPTVSPDHVPAALERAGLELVIAGDDPEAAYVDGFAAACEALFPFEVHRVDPATAGPGPTAHRIDLTEPGDQRDAKLRDLAAHLETFVLAPTR